MNEEYVESIQKLLQDIPKKDIDKIMRYFFWGAEYEFVRAVVDAIKPYMHVHWLQAAHGEESAIVILLLHGQDYALCEFHLFLMSKEWRIHNVILRPLAEMESKLFLGDLSLEASNDGT